MIRAELYRSRGLGGQRWRWRLRAANHLVIAHSGEAYRNRADCLHALTLVLGTTLATPIIDPATGEEVEP